MRQQENKKENFRENPTKLTWIPKVYNYAERTGNLKAEAVGVVSGEKHFPVFEDRMVFKPLTKSKPFSTPLFACAEVFWSWVIDTYFVPAGTVHGIGKGILVAEIQESSNVTYRVYDYDRVDKNGKKRELHFDKAVQVMDMNVEPDVSQKPRIVKYYSGCSRELLCRCKYFETERIQVTKGFAFSVMDTSFQVLMCLNGYGEVQTMDAEQKPMRFSKGETLFLPAGLGRCLVVGDAELIKVRC